MGLFLASFDVLKKRLPLVRGLTIDYPIEEQWKSTRKKNTHDQTQDKQTFSYSSDPKLTQEAVVRITRLSIDAENLPQDSSFQSLHQTSSLAFSSPSFSFLSLTQPLTWLTVKPFSPLTNQTKTTELFLPTLYSFTKTWYPRTYSFYLRRGQYDPQEAVATTSLTPALKGAVATRHPQGMPEATLQGTLSRSSPLRHSTGHPRPV